MKYLRKNISFQEVPNEISLAYEITGCDVGCKLCHSKELWDPSNGIVLTNEILIRDITKYKDLITTVLFLGGEWYESDLCEKLDIINKFTLKTCLYTGRNKISDTIKNKLTYVKLGPFIQHRGAITEKTTNQRFINTQTNEDLTHLFWSKK